MTDTWAEADGPLGDQVLMPNGLVAPFSVAYASGGFIFVSGQLAFDKSGKILEAGIAEQTACALANLESVLNQAGLDRSDLIKLTIWLTDKTDFSAFNDAYQTYFGNHRPARSTVISDLVIPGALVEIEGLASRRTL